MALSNKQKKWILKKKSILSVKKIAAELNIEDDDVQNYLDTIKTIPAKKSFYIIMILIPIVFFLLLEIFLRIFNYGIDTRTWINVTESHLGLNFDIAKRYFYNVKSVPNSIQDVFLEKKPANSFRVFVLGGSSAAGYPSMPLGSFSRYVRQRLENVYPNTKIEVVNLGLTAVNSYTIRDLIPDVLEEEPDLILIYAGHNEYYGALGAGSMESLGKSRTVVNFLLNLNQYKTFELLRNILQSVIKIFSSEDESASKGTLMSRMAQEKDIIYNSNTFNLGLEQFEGNMRDVIDLVEEKNVPLILSTLASNLKDQPPFISKKTDKFPNASQVYNQAQEALDMENYILADSLFRFAKDLDLLRFRAPEDINNIIKSLCEEYSLPYVDVDSALASLNENNIVGNDLMTDHLHPTLKGYQIIGKLFYEKMNDNNFLPNGTPKILEPNEQDQVTLANYHYTEFDSIITDFKLKLLKNDYPFVKPSEAKKAYELINLNNFLDSTAYDFIASNEEWETAYRKVAAYYLLNKDYKKFIRQMKALIHQFPVIMEYHNFAANELLQVKKYNEAYDFLKGKYSLVPDAYSSKWLGIIELSRNKTEIAISYLEESLNFNENDYQTLYNLAGAYSQKNEFKRALELVNKSLEINPDYSSARQLQQQLKAVQK